MTELTKSMQGYLCDSSPWPALRSFAWLKKCVAQNTKPDDDDFRWAVIYAARHLLGLPEDTQEEDKAYLLAVLEKYNHPDLWKAALEGALYDNVLTSAINKKREELNNG